jgi:hypothetical protein
MKIGGVGVGAERVLVKLVWGNVWTVDSAPSAARGPVSDRPPGRRIDVRGRGGLMAEEVTVQDRLLLERITRALKSDSQYEQYLDAHDSKGVNKLRALGRRAARDLGWKVRIFAIAPGKRRAKALPFGSAGTVRGSRLTLIPRAHSQYEEYQFRSLVCPA